LTIHLLALVMGGLLAGAEPPGHAILEGVVVNGSRGATPVAGAEVVLRAGKDKQFKHLASTTTDQAGSFVFDHRQLIAEPGLVYIPGANWEGVHYPGPGLQLDPARAPPRVRLTVYDAVASPSPLVAEMHEIDIRVDTGMLEVTEAIVVNNPSSTSYVGAPNAAMPRTAPATLSLSIPEGVSHVTFNKEFDGRNFRLVDGRLVTTVPWPPGKRQLAFRYQLPVEKGQLLFQRSLDLPCLSVRLAVAGECSQELTCNLPRVTPPNRMPIGFESESQTLPAGYTVQLQMRQLSISWIVYARWAAIILLGGLLGATTVRSAWRRGSHFQQVLQLLRRPTTKRAGRSARMSACSLPDRRKTRGVA
jgi:hypothetical protein